MSRKCVPAALLFEPRSIDLVGILYPITLGATGRRPQEWGGMQETDKKGRGLKHFIWFFLILFLFYFPRRKF